MTAVAGDALLPRPDLSDSLVLCNVAGIRPYRSGRIRLEAEQVDDLLLVHNYGHGGAGVTLSWGCAEEVVRLVRNRGRREPMAVLGAGVNGLSTAHALLDAGFEVTVYAKSFTPHTTSDLAGAQWAPSLVARGSVAGDPHQFERIVDASYRRFAALADSGEWGVFRRINFEAGGGGGLEHIPSDLIPAVEHVSPLPIEGVAKSGRLYRTMLIEPPIYLPRLMAEVRERGGEMIERSFQSIDDVLGLNERIVINCLGLGARDLIDDPRLIPVRGQLVHLQPQDLPYLLSHGEGYMFPRRDALVLGGTVERGVDDPTPTAAACRAILARNRRFFAPYAR